MTDAEKKAIDEMNYESMLRRWRFAPVGDPLFQGETGDYFSKIMFEKKEKIGAGAAVTASKNVGWDR